MSNFFLGDRIKETSRVVGTSDISLDGAAPGFSSFEDFYASGDVVFYAITDNVDYEVGSGVYFMDSSTRSITRNPFRSSDINVGPWYVNATSNSGPTDGSNGFFYPLWLSRSAAVSGVRVEGGPFTAPSGYTFDEYPGVTFYGITERAALGVGGSVPAGSGENYSSASQPVSFQDGLKEVFVTYPGKTAVYQGYGLESDTNEPKESGVAFWKNEQIINYSSEFVWDDNLGLLGINQPNPDFAVDVGGLVADSIVRASGFIEGGSGILMSGGMLTDTLLTASGGRQYEPFRRNRLDYSADGIIQLSGLVDQILGFAEQSAGTIFAGPSSSDCDPCDPAIPTFRQLDSADFPPSVAQDLGFIVQRNAGLDADTANTALAPFVNGMIAVYAGSGFVTYDSGILFDTTNNRLQVNGDASTQTPQYTVHVRGGDLAAESGYFNQVLFLDSNYRIGNFTGTNADNLAENVQNIFLGPNAGQISSGNIAGVFIGKQAGYNLDEGSAIIAIGLEAASSGDLHNNTIFIGRENGAYASGIDNSISLGYASTWDAEELSDMVAVGRQAASGASGGNTFVFLGKNAGAAAADIVQSVGIGADSLRGTSGVIDSFVAGEQSASGSFEFNEVVSIGNKVSLESSGISKSTILGPGAGRYAQTLDNVIAIGQNAALSGLELERTIAIGGLSASQASGSFNTYIGQDSGIGVSGHNNIEIVSSGTNVSFLTHEASGKVNIAEIIVGDQYTHRVSVGKPDDTSPSGTFVIRPENADESAFIIQHQGSGSATPYMVLQSGDQTTLFHITNSGDVITSGCVNPSGGLLLKSHIPSTTTNRLYNEAGTLKWNGSNVSMGGGMDHFDLRAQIDNTADSGVEISNDQTILFSGDYGIYTQIDSGNRQIIIDASPISGFLENKISAQDFAFKAGASGQEGSNNNDPFLMVQSDPLVPPVVLFSGISGINVDAFQLDDGLNNSGVFVFGYDTNATYDWRIRQQIDGVSGPAYTVLSNDLISVSGASGIETVWNANDLTLRVGASELSGVLYDTIGESGGFLYSQILENTTSGVAISGIAVWASGEFDRAGVGSLGTSGVILKDGFYTMDPDGSGKLSTLALYDKNNNTIIGKEFGTTESLLGSFPAANQFNVIIGDGAGSGCQDVGDSVIIGLNAAQNSDSYNIANAGPNIVIGYEAGFEASGDYDPSTPTVNNWNYDAINIGFKAGYQAMNARSAMFIGKFAGYQSRFQTNAAEFDHLFIGNNSFYEGLEGYRTVGVGSVSCYQASGLENSSYLGYGAGRNCSGVVAGTAVGYQAGSYQYDSRYSTSIGYRALSSNSGDVHGVAIGLDAGYQSYHHNNLIAIGQGAAEESSGNWVGSDVINGKVSELISIGRLAGKESHQCGYSIFIGSEAGRGLKTNPNSFIISTDNPDTSRFPNWFPDNQEGIFQIGLHIQGISEVTGGKPCAFHIGRTLRDRYTDGDLTIVGTISKSVFNVTSPSDSKELIRLKVPLDDTVDYRPQNEELADLEFQPDAPMVVAETWTDQDPTTGNTLSPVQAQKVTDGVPLRNIIVNPFGFLQIPIATSLVGSTNSNAALKDANDLVISKEDGTVCMVAEGVTTKNPNNPVMAVVIENEWYVQDYEAGTDTGRFVTIFAS